MVLLNNLEAISIYSRKYLKYTSSRKEEGYETSTCLSIDVVIIFLTEESMVILKISLVWP